MLDKLYIGCRVKVISCGSPWNWYSTRLGEEFIVIEIRPLYEDVIVTGKNCTGNCIDFEDLEFLV